MAVLSTVVFSVRHSLLSLSVFQILGVGMNEGPDNVFQRCR